MDSVVLMHKEDALHGSSHAFLRIPTHSAASHLHARSASDRVPTDQFVTSLGCQGGIPVFKVLESSFQVALFLHFRRLVPERIIFKRENCVLVLASANISHYHLTGLCSMRLGRQGRDRASSARQVYRLVPMLQPVVVYSCDNMIRDTPWFRI